MASPRGPRTVDEVKRLLHQRLEERHHPVGDCEPAAARAAIDRLRSLDGENWGQVWAEAAQPFVRAAQEAEARGDTAAASGAHFQAYSFYYAGRYPCPNHPRKAECAAQARAHYLAAARGWDPPLERVSIPFAGRPGEGSEVVGYLRKPRGDARPPLVIHWGGIDGYKEERHANAEAMLEQGLASLAIDMPGTGESPVVVSPDGERQFAAVLDWVKGRRDVDGGRVAVMGSSFGGYWSVKLAHLYPERLRGAVCWGGGVHRNFLPDWTEAARYAESYLFDLAECRAHACGVPDYEAYKAYVPALSLLDSGLLDRPCAPLLLINGKDDVQVPLADYYLMLEHGSPKDIRLFPGGHMGRTPQTVPTILNWLSARLA
jgi:esterase FrsA